MNRQKVFRMIVGLLLLTMLTGACNAATPTPVPPMPTATLYPSPTPYPTYTPYPAATSTPMARQGQWVKGHFLSIKVVDVRTATQLDGVRPLEDLFVVVEVDWKTNNVTMWHNLGGSDFELVDAGGNIFEMSGMILRPDNAEEPQGPGEKYDESTYRTNKVRGTVGDTYKLVYDVPTSVSGLKLWFQDFPLIDLGLTLP